MKFGAVIESGGGASRPGPLEEQERLESMVQCNFCIHFRGYGLHACAGHCVKLDKDIGGGYIGNYRKVGKDCDYFECIPAFLINDEGGEE